MPAKRAAQQRVMEMVRTPQALRFPEKRSLTAPQKLLGENRGFKLNI
jgi:hypothetical protein